MPLTAIGKIIRRAVWQSTRPQLVPRLVTSLEEGCYERSNRHVETRSSQIPFIITVVVLVQLAVEVDSSILHQLNCHPKYLIFEDTAYVKKTMYIFSGPLSYQRWFVVIQPQKERFI